MFTVNIQTWAILCSARLRRRPYSIKMCPPCLLSCRSSLAAFQTGTQDPHVAPQVAAEADAEVAYARIGALCEAIKAELNNDLKIHDQGILPSFITLPRVTAGEYCRVSDLTLET